MKIGITFGAFDLCHTGHNLMFKECKSNCDYLIVGLHVDPSIERVNKNKPVQSLFERSIILDSSKYIDKIIPYQFEDDILVMLKSLPIDVRFIGSDYINKNFTGKQYCLEKNIEIYYNKRDHCFSTSELRKRIENSNNR